MQNFRTIFCPENILTTFADNKHSSNPFSWCMGKRYKQVWWIAVSTAIFLLQVATSCTYAQIGLGGGFEYGTAAVVNNGIFIRKPNMAITAMLSYAPRDARLFPSFTYLLKTIYVPVANDTYPNINVPATDQHFALNLNYRTNLESDYHLLFLGVGVAKINAVTNLIDEQGNAITLTNTLASAHLYPLMQVGGKYMHRILPNSSFYVGLEANLKYIRMHSDDVYYLQQGSNSVKAAVAGDIIFPGLQVLLAYFLDGKEE